MFTSRRYYKNTLIVLLTPDVCLVFCCYISCLNCHKFSFMAWGNVGWGGGIMPLYIRHCCEEDGSIVYYSWTNTCRKNIKKIEFMT